MYIKASLYFKLATHSLLLYLSLNRTNMFQNVDQKMIHDLAGELTACTLMCVCGRMTSCQRQCVCTWISVRTLDKSNVHSLTLIAETTRH